MESCEAGLDRIEAQSPTDVSRDQRKGRYFPMNLIKKGANTLCSRGFFQSRRDGSMPPTGDTESGTELLTNLTLLDLYNVPGESAEMNSEIFSAMRRGNREFFDKMKRWETPMACFKNDKGDSILHLAAAFGHVELVKDILSACPSLLLLTNSKNQVPLHVAACGGHLAVVEALVASVTFFSAQVSKEEDRERLNVYGLKDKNGDTPLHLALKDLHEKKESLLNQHRPRYPSVSGLIKYLQRIRCSSFPDASTRLIETAVCLVNANQGASFLANSEKISPLYLAVEAGNLSLVNAMLNHLGETSTFASQLEGTKSLVHAALKSKNTDVLDVILNEFLSLVDEPDDEGRTCISVGASVGFKEGLCKVLDRTTLSIFKCDKDGSYPIHMAVEKGHEDVVRELLRRFPDSIELINKKGQNSLHIAAKSGKARTDMTNLCKKNHLIEEQDDDGNTPLHLATIHWRPRKVWTLTGPASTTTKVLNIRNAKGLRPLDIAEAELQHAYVFRERMTLMVLLGVYKPKGISWLPMSGMTLKSRLKKPRDCDIYKDRVNILLLVATLVATMTFAAGFTMPGGFYSDDPYPGMAILIADPMLKDFLFSDSVAMYSSLVAIVALIWAQLGDEDLAHRAFHLALPALFLALCSMSFAFYYGLLATTMANKYIKRSINFVFMIFWEFFFSLLAPYVILQVSGIPFIYRFTCNFLLPLLWLVNEDDDENHPTSGSDVKNAESVGSSSGIQVEKSKEV
ncbi:unnamed protein product [Arabis nemorensis]|uniref:PGG domain-containing protein n=1 Tax=Arabis nemorensis TaxID=586526 RepID=A0A565C0F3_9BRAS|nr:unnamed protein product [Arabis nemorensis]